jgi:hypothetical protein
MQIRLLGLGLALPLCLNAQYGGKKFNWQDACFFNPGLPYCFGHDYAIKPKPGSKKGVTTSDGRYVEAGPSTIDAVGIDWRFADPSAEALAVLDCSKLQTLPLARGLIEQLGAAQGLSQPDIQKILRGLSGVGQVALSVHDEKVVLMVTGRGRDSILPAPEPGWKATSLEGNVLLIGHEKAVDEAAQRLLSPKLLDDMALLAQHRPADTQFWAIGSAKLAGEEAATAGVKRFSLTASIQDRLTSNTVFEFDSAPDVNTIQPWMKTFSDAKIEGNSVRVAVSMEADQARASSSQIAAGLLGQHLGTLIKSARNLPVRDTATTIHTKPVIYGLEDGPREVK